MKWSALAVGQRYQFSIIVTEAMQAAFEETVVHALYGSAAMLTHMEWASRQLLLPALEEDEEGVGADMHIKHLAPAVIGATVTIEAIITGLHPSTTKAQRLTTLCTAWEGDRCLGRGTIIQAILPITALPYR